MKECNGKYFILLNTSFKITIYLNGISILSHLLNNPNKQTI